jgi:hypothetical protein
MKRQGPDHLEPELEALLEPRKIERHVPPELRARVLAGARAIVATDGAIPRPPTAELPPPTRRAARGRRLAWIAVAASIAVGAGAVGAAAALLARGARPAEIAPPQSAPPPKAPITHVPAATSEPLAPEAQSAPAKPLRPAPVGAKTDPFTAELELLQRAHTAYTSRDFLAALALIAEHARRVPKGHLAEQREALRVRSLAGAGRTDEARRAAAAFAIRFPRSVLLPRVAEGSESSAR